MENKNLEKKLIASTAIIFISQVPKRSTVTFQGWKINKNREIEERIQHVQAEVECKDTSREAQELENFGKASEIFSVEHHKTTPEGLPLGMGKATEVATMTGNALVGAVHI